MHVKEVESFYDSNFDWTLPLERSLWQIQPIDSVFTMGPTGNTVPGACDGSCLTLEFFIQGGEKGWIRAATSRKQTFGDRMNKSSRDSPLDLLTCSRISLQTENCFRYPTSVLRECCASAPRFAVCCGPGRITAGPAWYYRWVSNGLPLVRDGQLNCCLVQFEARSKSGWPRSQAYNSIVLLSIKLNLQALFTDKVFYLYIAKEMVS